MEEWSLQPQSVIYVGDTKTDMITASKIGFFAVGVTWGFRPGEELTAHGAQVLMEQPDQLLGLL